MTSDLGQNKYKKLYFFLAFCITLLYMAAPNWTCHLTISISTREMKITLSRWKLSSTFYSPPILPVLPIPLVTPERKRSIVILNVPDYLLLGYSSQIAWLGLVGIAISTLQPAICCLHVALEASRIPPMPFYWTHNFLSFIEKGWI